MPEHDTTPVTEVGARAELARDVNAPTSVVVGVDLGGTKTASARVDADGKYGEVYKLPTPAADGPDAVLDTVARLIRTVASDGHHLIRAVGVGTAGVVDVSRGVIISATETLPQWPGTDVTAGIQRRIRDLAPGGTPVPVFVENDVDAHAAGEDWLGAATGAHSALLVAVGTGVGASIILEGRTLRGAHHLAGEIGHLPIPGARGLRCPCGRPGHLEAIAAGPALHRRYLALGGDPDCRDARDVVARAARNDELAERVVTEAGTALGQAIAGVATVLDPEVVVIGGGMAAAGQQWWTAMLSALRAEVVDVLVDLPVRPALLGGDAAIVGAARSAWRMLEEKRKTP